MFIGRSQLMRIIRRKMDRKLFNVIQLGLAFMLVFSAFNTQSFVEIAALNAVANATSSTSHGIAAHSGYYSLSIIYATFTFSNFFAPPLIGVIGAKWSMVVGASCYCIFMASFLYLVNVWILYITSALVGFGAAILWTGQGSYLTANSSNETMTRNSGLLWALLQSSLITGAIFLFFTMRATKEIDQSTVRIMYTCFTGVCIAGIIMLMLLANVSETDDRLTVGTDDDRDALVESFSVQNQNIVDSVSNISTTVAPKKSILEDFVQTFRLLMTRDMLLLSIVFLYSGIEMTFWTGVYSTCLTFTQKLSDEHKDLLAFNSFALGIGQIIGGGLFGIFAHRSQKCGRNVIVMLGAVLHLIAFYLIFLNLPMESPLQKTTAVSYMQPNYYLALLCALMLGLADSCWNTQIYSLLGSRYTSQSASAFALYKFFQSAAACASFYYGSLLLLHWQLAILGVGAIVATLCFLPVEWSTLARINADVKTA